MGGVYRVSRMAIIRVLWGFYMGSSLNQGPYVGVLFCEYCFSDFNIL